MKMQSRFTSAFHHPAALGYRDHQVGMGHPQAPEKGYLQTSSKDTDRPPPNREQLCIVFALIQRG